MENRGESMNLTTMSRRGNIGVYAAHTEANNAVIIKLEHERVTVVGCYEARLVNTI